MAKRECQCNVLSMILHNPAALSSLREGAKTLVSLTHKLKDAVEPGKNAAQIDALAFSLAQEAGVKVAFHGYQGFPAAVCVSVNDEVAHGLPSREKIFKEGDIVSLDFGIVHEGFFTDYAITFALGTVGFEIQALIEVTKQALDVGIERLAAGVRTGDIGSAIERFVRSKGPYGVVKKLVGHGIGENLHEDPQIPNFGFPGTGYKFSEGEVVALEPMITLGSGDIRLGADGQTYKTIDGSLAAHFEKTVVVTKNGAEVLT